MPGTICHSIFAVYTKSPLLKGAFFMAKKLSVSDAETLIIIAILQRRNIDFCNLCHRWSFSEPFDEFFDQLIITLCPYFDRAVGKVLDIAFDVEGFGLFFCVPSEAHTLDYTCYYYLDVNCAVIRCNLAPPPADLYLSFLQFSTCNSVLRLSCPLRGRRQFQTGFHSCHLQQSGNRMS